MANIQRIMDALNAYTGEPETLTTFTAIVEEELGADWTNTIYDLVPPMTPDQKERLDHVYHYYGATLAWAEVQGYLAQQEPLNLAELSERIPTLEYWLNFFGDNGLQIINELNEKMKQQALMDEVSQPSLGTSPETQEESREETNIIPSSHEPELPDIDVIEDWSEQSNLEDIQMIDINEDGRTPQIDDTLPQISSEEIVEPIESIVPEEEIVEPIESIVPEEEIIEPIESIVPEEEIVEPIESIVPEEEIVEPIESIVPEEEIVEPIESIVPEEEIVEPIESIVPEEEIAEPIDPIVPEENWNNESSENMPYDENSYPTENMSYDENSYPTENMPYDENGYPTENMPYDENGYPTENMPYDENGYPTENMPYDENGYPTENMPYDENGYPTENMPYDENGYPTENMPYDENSYPTENMPYDENSYPTENMPYDENGYPTENIPYTQPVNNTTWEGESLTSPIGFVNKVQTLNNQRPQDERIVKAPQYQPQKPETNEQFLAKKAFKQLDFVNGVHAWIEARCIGLGNIEIYKYKHYGFLVDAMEQARKNIKEVLASPAYYPAIEATRLNGLQTLQNSLVALEKDLETAYDNLPGEITNLIKEDIDSDEARRMLGMLDTSTRKEYLGPAPDGFEMIDDPFDDANKV
ncbi:MAG: hypothetical protein IJY58_04710 [Alphaproteobacteria bacterium]|nr:hypothetical protein [Alphaproteobacteria bacterium]